MIILKPLQNIINNLKKDRIPNLKPEGFKLIAVLLCLTIFGVGLWIGSINLAPSSSDNLNNIEQNYAAKFQIFAPVIIEFGLIRFFVFFIDSYVKGSIDKVKEDYENRVVLNK